MTNVEKVLITSIDKYGPEDSVSHCELCTLGLLGAVGIKICGGRELCKFILLYAHGYLKN